MFPFYLGPKGGSVTKEELITSEFPLGSDESDDEEEGPISDFVADSQ